MHQCPSSARAISKILVKFFDQIKIVAPMRDFEERRFGKNFYRLVTTCNGGKSERSRLDGDLQRLGLHLNASAKLLARTRSARVGLQRRKFDCSRRLGIDLQGEALPQPGQAAAPPTTWRWRTAGHDSEAPAVALHRPTP
jgi:hypothetical protein